MILQLIPDMIQCWVQAPIQYVIQYSIQDPKWNSKGIPTVPRCYNPDFSPRRACGAPGLSGLWGGGARAPGGEWTTRIHVSLF